MEENIKCFISYKKEDEKYKRKIIEKLGENRIKVRALDDWIESNDAERILQEIRKKYMSETNVTIFLIGKHSSEVEGKDGKGKDKNYYIKRELQATLYDRDSYKRSGLLGVVLPMMERKVFGTKYKCELCGEKHNSVTINDSTVTKEFSSNYYLGTKSKKICTNKQSFCVLVRYCDFMNDPDKYIEQAFQKRTDDIANQVHWKDLRKK